MEVILDRFERYREERQVLEEFVLPHISALSTAKLSENAVESLIGSLNVKLSSRWRPPLIGKIATEEVVEGRLMPLLLADPPERLRANLIIALEEAGRRHGRRYVGENGQVLS